MVEKWRSNIAFYVSNVPKFFQQFLALLFSKNHLKCNQFYGYGST